MNRKKIDLSCLPEKEQETTREILDYLADFEKSEKVFGNLCTINQCAIHVPTKIVRVPTKTIHVPTKIVSVPTKLQVIQTTSLVIRNALTERKT